MKARRRQRNSQRVSRPGHWLEWLSSRRVVLLFVVRFLVFLGALHVLSLAPWFQQYLPLYLHAIASGANGCAHLFGESSEVAGTTLRSAVFGVTVAPECSAIEFVWFISAVVLAFPATWRARALGVLLAAALGGLINVLRVASLLLVGVHAHSLFALVHEELWAVPMVVAAALFVAAWIHWLSGRGAFSLDPHDGHAST
jgi:exosortase/archaeosortase family protein